MERFSEVIKKYGKINYIPLENLVQSTRGVKIYLSEDGDFILFNEEEKMNYPHLDCLFSLNDEKEIKVRDILEQWFEINDEQISCVEITFVKDKFQFNIEGNLFGTWVENYSFSATTIQEGILGLIELIKQNEEEIDKLIDFTKTQVIL
ncbi:MAG: hypothetical protein LBH96_03595 [Candidatus Peribacteria bacterium]|jgi:hypothetical protein|nr:hypothetical protein [Candidatus Peribacteria bacterium]